MSSAGAPRRVRWRVLNSCDHRYLIGDDVCLEKPSKQGIVLFTVGRGDTYSDYKRSVRDKVELDRVQTHVPDDIATQLSDIYDVDVARI